MLKRFRLKRYSRVRQPRPVKPLVLRTEWGNFAHRLHHALELDVEIALGELSVEEASAVTDKLPLDELPTITMATVKMEKGSNQ